MQIDFCFNKNFNNLFRFQIVCTYLKYKIREICLNTKFPIVFIFFQQKMNRNHLAVVLATILIVTGMLALHQNEQEIQKEPQTVPFVNLTRYSGTWWEQSYIPYYWERGCANTHAIYSIKDNGEVKVDNHCDKNGQDAHNVGKAIAEDSTNAKLKIQFVQTLDVGAQYWVVRLGNQADYGHVVVTSPNYNYLWIMSRQKKMDDKLYNEIIDWLKAQGGYRVDKLVKTIIN